MRLVDKFGSKYKSAPHITLYLARYTNEGIEKLPDDLQKLSFAPFTFTLGAVKKLTGKSGFHYVMEVSDKEHFIHMHDKISLLTSPYRSDLLRTSDQKRVQEGVPLENWSFDPHITLGAVPFDSPQPDIDEICENIGAVTGKEITVTNFTAFFYGKPEDNDDPSQLLKEICFPLV
jgi:2'-5' RNA ligase